jgi:putative PIN family toxin of toxin-antitoxin system
VIRGVLDTNIAVAAGKSQSPTSPNREIIDRWLQGQFTLLISKDIAAEYALKLRDRGIDTHTILAFLRHLALFAEIVEIKYFHFRHYPIDENDIAFLLCAVNGNASHLVSYDPHLLDLDIHYPEIDFLPPIPFLQTLRQIHSTDRPLP